MNRFRCSPMLASLAALLLTLAPAAALAQQEVPPDAGTQGPGGSPDAGPEEPEDTTGRIVEVCRETIDCSPRFVCDDGRCRYNGTREAERVGCMLGPQATLLLVGVGLAVSRRRRAP